MPIASARDLVRFAETGIHPSRQVCAQLGSKLNPYKVEIRSHERQAMIFRYLVYKGIETALFGMITHGQRIPTFTDVPSADVPNLPVELALRQGLELAIRGQAPNGAWFYFIENRDSAFFRDATGNIAKLYNRSSGETKDLKKSSVSEFIDQRIKQQEEWDRLYSAGRAI